MGSEMCIRDSQTLRKLSEDIKEGKAKGDAETQIQRKRMQEELERGLASQSRIAEDEISKLRATMQSQFESESNEKYSAAVAAMEAIEESASRRQKSDREQILSLETKLENSLMELTRVKQEKESMEERTTHVVTEATAITEKINEMERVMLEDRAALQAAHKEKDELDARVARAEKAALASQEEVTQANAMLETVQLDLQEKENIPVSYTHLTLPTICSV